MLKTPPLNLVMENVTKYIDADTAWLSDSFFSHQIGYKICLAIKIESSPETDGSLNLVIGVTSVEGSPGSYLSYPCSGFATVAILNPHQNYGHKVLAVVFLLENIALNSYKEIISEVVNIPRQFITQGDCIFFQVEKIDLDETKHKLWLLDATVVNNVHHQLQY